MEKETRVLMMKTLRVKKREEMMMKQKKKKKKKSSFDCELS